MSSSFSCFSSTFSCVEQHATRFRVVMRLHTPCRMNLIDGRRFLRDFYAISTRFLRDFYAISTRFLRGSYAISTRSLSDFYARSASVADEFDRSSRKRSWCSRSMIARLLSRCFARIYFAVAMSIEPWDGINVPDSGTRIIAIIVMVDVCVGTSALVRSSVQS
jgi:hypothetical protein